MDSSERQNHDCLNKFHKNIVLLAQLGVPSSVLMRCLDVVEETDQIIANPECHRAAYHLTETEVRIW